MLSARFRAYLRQHHWGMVATFLVVSGGTAYALEGTNTVNSGDLINNQVKSADVRDDTLAGGGLKAVDLATGAVGNPEIAANAIGTGRVIDNSLTGADINEQTLSGVANCGIRPSVTAGLASDGANDRDRFGAALSIGDFDADGFGDLGIGEPQKLLGDISPDCQATVGGGVHALYGAMTGLTVDGDQFFTQNTPGIGGDGAEPCDGFSYALAVR